MCLDSLGKNFNLDQSSLVHDYLNVYESEIDSTKNETIIVVGNSLIAYKCALVFVEYYANKKIVFLTNNNFEPKDNLKVFIYSDFRECAQFISTINDIGVVVDHSDNFFKNKIGHFNSIFPLLSNNAKYYIEDIHACFMEKFKDDDYSIYDKMQKIMSSGKEFHSLSNFEKKIRSMIFSVTYYGKLIKVVRSNVKTFYKLQEYYSDNYFKFNKIYLNELNLTNCYTFESKCLLNTNRNKFRDYMPKTLNVPGLKLREYNDVVCVPGQLLFKNNILLPEYQRRTVRAGHNNKNIQFSSDFFISHEFDKPIFLSGTYLYLDSEYDSHFGHVLVEQISKLWAYEIFKKNYPNGKVLIGALSGIPYQLMIDILIEYGVPFSDIIYIDKPFNVEHLVCPSQMYQIGYYIDKNIELIWDKLRIKFSQKSKISKVEKIFLGRSPGSRGCHNSDVVEKIFSENGYKIIYPEKMPFFDQVFLFANADKIAGYGGSATLNSIFCKPNIERTIIKSDSYEANNDFLISSVKGGKLNICFCDADIKHGERWSIKAFMSDYTFNESRDTDFLLSCI